MSSNSNSSSNSSNSSRGGSNSSSSSRKENPIDVRLREVMGRGEYALIGYMVAGYPDEHTCLDVALAMIDGGVDILEIGIPFSDPIADGPTIQRASYIALSNGITPRKALDIARRIKDASDTPLVAMTYYNIVYRLGVERFIPMAREHGIDGLIVPDLTYEEADDVIRVAHMHGMDPIFLVAPNTSDERINMIASVSKGFLYLVSVYGTTGERDRFYEYTTNAIRRVKGLMMGRVPLAVGFGISRKEHVRLMIDAGADAIVVGSAFINIIEKRSGCSNSNNNSGGSNGSSNKGSMLEDVRQLAYELKQATRSSC
ncbi:Tryptophan synthase alpha chain [archaeon HR04]|nr:Tryptophan synthase alpha chain [archaeon HR04]